ncbi:hypothetical protein ACFPTO_11880 [Paraburkholderia denitrificans]|uniref:Uncharacterized protein n=1 Tax=Paraburkholderia denitrificans TaxID=694025 RepID=A0ABW0J8U6_9BURK
MTLPAWPRGACSDPVGPRLATGSALPEAIDGIEVIEAIGQGDNRSRFLQSG